MENTNQQLETSPLHQKNNYSKQIIILFLTILISGIIGYFLGKISLNKTIVQTPQQAVFTKPTNHPSIADDSQAIITNANQTLTEAIGSPVSKWKTYSSSRVIFSYPPTWNVREQSPIPEANNTESILITDMKNSENLQPGYYGHIGYTVDLFSDTMPKEFGWTNGQATNPTIRAYSINGYQGTWDEEETEPSGKTEDVLLANPNGGYAQIQFPNPLPPLSDGTEMYVIFSEILSTFHFTNK